MNQFRMSDHDTQVQENKAPPNITKRPKTSFPFMSKNGATTMMRTSVITNGHSCISPPFFHEVKGHHTCGMIEAILPQKIPTFKSGCFLLSRHCSGDEIFSRSVARELSSPLPRFTSEFGKGSGGTRAH